MIAAGCGACGWMEAVAEVPAVCPECAARFEDGSVHFAAFLQRPRPFRMGTGERLRLVFVGRWNDATRRRIEPHAREFAELVRSGEHVDARSGSTPPKPTR